ncbi:type II secretion system major pseudopilin GspG [Prosthecomicrobium hirschii]|uniref:type II secretion system major pseudopilin GspG n=1 Tax=Prosthecodimorpha hirschii TaxID=665126 RepID=UPI00221F5142|nr:type II secretion system major pseudopilin GspG [Prosthecomicrobium hirschii]MCW1842725.1 type II secretion system major pseudopilin GspG [Prosthecomicrobium hirschii]
MATRTFLSRPSGPAARPGDGRPAASRRPDAKRLDRLRAGFTLVEMLVVLVIIGLLVGLVGPRVFNQLSDAKTKTARIQIESFTNALDLFFLDMSRYPTTAEGLNALMVRPNNAATWNGPYLRGNGVPRDPWNNAYLYRSPGQGRPYEIVSLGSDGREGGTDSAADLNNWQR